MLSPESFSEPFWISRRPVPRIGIAPETPPPPKFMTSAPSSTTALPPPTRNAGPPVPHCIVAPLSITTAPLRKLVFVTTIMPATTRADPPPEKLFAKVTGPE